MQAAHAPLDRRPSSKTAAPLQVQLCWSNPPRCVIGVSKSVVDCSSRGIVPDRSRARFSSQIVHTIRAGERISTAPRFVWYSSLSQSSVGDYRDQDGGKEDRWHRDCEGYTGKAEGGDTKTAGDQSAVQAQLGHLPRYVVEPLPVEIKATTVLTEML